MNLIDMTLPSQALQFTSGMNNSLFPVDLVRSLTNDMPDSRIFLVFGSVRCLVRFGEIPCSCGPRPWWSSVSRSALLLANVQTASNVGNRGENPAVLSFHRHHQRHCNYPGVWLADTLQRSPGSHIKPIPTAILYAFLCATMANTGSRSRGGCFSGHPCRDCTISDSQQSRTWCSGSCISHDTSIQRPANPNNPVLDKARDFHWSGGKSAAVCERSSIGPG